MARRAELDAFSLNPPSLLENRNPATLATDDLLVKPLCELRRLAKRCRERNKKVRRWYWRNGDKWFFQLRYGAKVLDLGKGRNAVEVDNEDALIEAIDVCSAAVKAGELDKALQEVAEIKSKGL